MPYRILWFDNDFEQVAAYVEALQLEGHHVDTVRTLDEADQQMAAGWYDLGLVLSRRKRYREALEAFRKAAELAPDAPEVLEAARSYLESAPADDPLRAVAQRIMAMCKVK